MLFSFSEVIMLGMFVLALLTYLNKRKYPAQVRAKGTGYFQLVLGVSHPSVVQGTGGDQFLIYCYRNTTHGIPQYRIILAEPAFSRKTLPNCRKK